MNTILLVDAWPVVTAGLGTLLREAGINQGIKQAHTVHDAVQAINGDQALLICDPALSDTTPDMLVTLARRKQPSLPILFFCSRSHGIHLSLAHMLGVNGYLDKASDAHTIIAAVRMVLAGMQCFPHQQGFPAKGAANLKQLSSRELVVLQLLRQGMRNKEIAQRLCLSPKTVSTHKRNLLRKLDLGDDIVSTQLEDQPMGDNVQVLMAKNATQR